jgi:hypothetical protein
MAELRELSVSELGQIEGGGGNYTCSPGLVCDSEGKNCTVVAVCFPTK